MKRGKIECSLHFHRAISDSAELMIDRDLVQQLRAKLDELSEILHESRAIDPIDVLRWPDLQLSS